MPPRQWSERWTIKTKTRTGNYVSTYLYLRAEIYSKNKLEKGQSGVHMLNLKCYTYMGWYVTWAYILMFYATLSRLPDMDEPNIQKHSALYYPRR